jgi:NAD+ kinase
VVVSRGRLARLINLDLRVNGEHLTRLRSDGLIVCTPTGSTAYSVSAGGPLMHPGVAGLLLTPVCPFLSGLRPLVVPDDSRIGVSLEEPLGEVFLTEDGQEVLELRGGDAVRLARAETDLVLADPGLASPFDRLKSRGFIGSR